MKKGAKIGLSIGVLFLLVIVGIASIPDEVLTENNTVENKEVEIFSVSEKPKPTAPEPAQPSEPQTPEPAQPSEPQTPEPAQSSEPQTPEPAQSSEPQTPEPSEQENQSDETESNVIRVEISDGVGSGDR